MFFSVILLLNTNAYSEYCQSCVLRPIVKDNRSIYKKMCIDREKKK